MTNTNNEEKLSLTSIISYGLGGGSMYLIDILFISFIMYFYTDVFGLNAGAVGTMLFVAKIWDGINDPMVGIIVDRTKTKWGKVRPYILFAPIPTAILLILTFTSPELSETGKMIWAYCTYIGLGMAYTVVTTSIMALNPLMTRKSSERIKLNQARMIVTTSLGVVISAATMPLILKVGFQATAICYGVIFIALMLIMFINTKEISYESNSSSKPKISVKLQLKTVFGNIHFLKIAFANFFVAVGSGIVAGSTLFYVTYYIKNPNIFSIVTPISMVCSLLAVLITGKIATKIGKKKTVLLGLFIAILGLGIRLVTKDQYILLYVILSAITTCGIGLYSVCLVPMFSDTIEYGQEKTGIRADGLTMSSYTLLSKVGNGIGTALLGKILVVIGYVAGQEQTVRTLNGLMHCNITAYILTLGCAFIILFTYTLNEKKVEEIQLKLKGNDSISN